MNYKFLFNFIKFDIKQNWRDDRKRRDDGFIEIYFFLIDIMRFVCEIVS